MLRQQTSVPKVPIISKNFGELTGREAWSQNVRLAGMAAGIVASSLGPRGACKLVEYHRGPELVVKLTKDAVDVVDELGVQYPAVKVIAEGAKLHRKEVGDGVSTMLVLVSALLGEAEKLIAKGIHQGIILHGYGLAKKEAIRMVDELSAESGGTPDQTLVRTVDCGRNLLSPALGSRLSEAVRELAKEGGTVDLSRIRIVQKLGGSTADTEFIRGTIVRKGRADNAMPREVIEPRVAIVNMKLEIRPLELKMRGEGPFPVKLNITNQTQMRMFLAEEGRMRSRIVEKLKALGVRALFCRGKIEQRIASSLGREGIFAAQLVDQEDLDALEKACGATTVGDVNLLTTEDLGRARKLEASKLGPDEIVVLHCDRGASFLLRGSSPELLQELEKVVKNALLILKHSLTNPRVVPGAGALFMHISSRLRKAALDYPGREQLVIGAFADALEQVPRCLARNSGLDPLDAMVELRRQHLEGRSWTGITEEGLVGVCGQELVELASVNKATIMRACDIAALLLRIDHYFYVKELPLVHKQ
jgi:chaperonin GroEL (HSP60 family)